MEWGQIEKSFGRALLLSFSKKKIALAFPVLILCGVLTVFCRAVACEAGEWVSMSLAFLPILLSSGVLLALGILLIRLHIYEVKHLRLGIGRLLKGSVDLLIGTSYLSVLPILAYLLLWVVLGLFYLLQEMPGVGDFFKVVLSFGPFLLVFGSLVLCFFNLAILFFVAPAAAFQSEKRFSLAKRVLILFQGRILSSFALFLIALFPIGVVSGLLSLSALLTHSSFDKPLSVAFEWFFMMIPFCAVLTPAVIFFFNFAAESYQLLKPKAIG